MGWDSGVGPAKAWIERGDRGRGHCSIIKNDCLRAVPAYLLPDLALPKEPDAIPVASGVDDTVYRRNRHLPSVISVTHACERHTRVEAFGKAQYRQTLDFWLLPCTSVFAELAGCIDNSINRNPENPDLIARIPLP